MYGTRYALVVVTILAIGTGVCPASNESIEIDKELERVFGLAYRPGARERAMGGAGVASAEGAVSAYYNPALLAWQDVFAPTGYGPEVGGTYYGISRPYGFNDMSFMYIPVMFDVSDWGRFAVDWTYLSIGTGVIYDRNGQPSKTHLQYMMAVGLSYSTKVSRRLSVGGTVKYLRDYSRSEVPGEVPLGISGTGIAFDLGLAYRWSERLMFGAALRNYGPNVEYTEDLWQIPLPVSFDAGAGWKLIDRERFDVTVVGDLSKPLVLDLNRNGLLAPVRGWTDEDVYRITEQVIDGEVVRTEHKSTLRTEMRQVDVHTGLEYTYADRYSVRGGWYRDWDRHRSWLTLGAGALLPISVVTVAVDYGYVRNFDEYGDSSLADDVQSWTLSIAF